MEPQWKGLTLDEIRMRRVLVQARMEIQKYKLADQCEQLRERTTFVGGGNSLLSRMAGVMSYAEYAILAFKMFRKISPMFKRKK